MTNGNRAIFIEEHQGHGFAENGTASNHHGVFAFEGDVVVRQQPHDAGRCC